MAAFALPLVVGAVGLAFDVNRGLEQRVQNQRAADMAALGAAMSYVTSQNSGTLQAVAADLAKANGVDGAVSAALVADYPNSGESAVRVDVTSQVPFVMARVLGFAGSYTVRTQSWASVTSQPAFAAPCFLALSTANDAITVSGGATIQTPTCSVAAVGAIDNQGNLISAHDIVSGQSNITVSWGTLTADSLRFGGQFIKPDWNNNVPPANKRVNQATTLIDPWAQSQALIDARGLIGTSVAVPALLNPDTSCSDRKDWNLEWNPGANSPVKNYWTGSGYNIPAGNHCIGRLTTGGGLTITFANGSNLKISNGVAIGGGTSVNFGNSNLYINGGFDSGSSGVTIGDGDLWIGSGTVSFQGTNRKGHGNIQVNATINLGGGQYFYAGDGLHLFGGFNLGGGGSVIMGTGNFVAKNGVSIAGGSELAIGNGDVLIGAASSGRAIYLDGSARFFMGDGLFSASGHIVTSGGSRLVFGRTPNHFIKGNLQVAGSVIFGEGRYTIDGNFINGTGGTTWPYTSSLKNQTYGSAFSGFDMGGTDVTFILSGTLNLAGGAKTKLKAGTTSPSGGQIANMLVATATTAQTTWGAGSSSTFVGTTYLPNSVVRMTGGNSTVGSGECWTLIALKIQASGGAQTGTACPEMDIGSGGPGGVKLVR